MDWTDLILFPLFYLVVTIVFSRVSNKISSPLDRKYFNWALHAKIWGGIALASVYQFYYGKGDTFHFYHDSSFLYELFWEDPSLALKAVVFKLRDLSPDYSKFRMYFPSDQASLVVIRLAFILGLFCFNSYTVIATVFTLISFCGIWLIYRVFRELVGGIDKKMALAILFFPSVVFWGSGFMKDPITVGVLGIFFYCFYTLFIKGKVRFKYLLFLLISLIVLKTLKVYVLYSFLPACGVWIYIEYKSKIKNKALRFFSIPFLLAFIGGMGYLVLNKVQAEGRYSLENVASSAVLISDYLYNVSTRDGGSAFTLSTTFDGSITSGLKVAPEALMVAYFRPFLWEARNPLMLVSGIENTYILFLFLQAVLLLISKKKINKLTRNSGLLYTAIVFSVILGVGITISTANLGSLSRYRIPFLPFLICALFLIIESRKNRQNELYD
ncbi:MAG: hypothetical protein AB8B61_04955 [Cyclobacteriaceae bacterium]